MGRAEKRREERVRRKAQEDRKKNPGFLKRNWMKIALPALGVAAAASIAAGVILSRDSKPPPTEQQKVERVLSIAKQRIGECYDNAYKFWQTEQGNIGCDNPLARMFTDIDSAANIGFGSDFYQNIDILKKYLASNGIFMDFLEPEGKGEKYQVFT